jgi:hypothetical protein
MTASWTGRLPPVSVEGGDQRPRARRIEEEVDILGAEGAGRVVQGRPPLEDDRTEAESGGQGQEIVEFGAEEEDVLGVGLGCGAEGSGGGVAGRRSEA